VIQPIENISRRIDDVVESSPDALLVRATTGGTDRASGGAYEWEVLNLVVFGPDGLITHTEWFDADREADALARFDELRTEQRPDPLRIPPNAAGAAIDRVQAAFEARDLERMRALCAPQMVYDERRKLVRTTGDREFIVNAS
jgi:hypothetical protein